MQKIWLLSLLRLLLLLLLQSTPELRLRRPLPVWRGAALAFPNPRGAAGVERQTGGGGPCLWYQLRGRAWVEGGFLQAVVGGGGQLLKLDGIIRCQFCWPRQSASRHL